MGIGPGELEQMSFRARKALEESEVIVGYRAYLDLIPGLLAGKKVVESGMTQEVGRCREALALARSGLQVAVVSGGDPGVYGMAGLILELLEGREDVPVEVIPGITAATAAAAVLGAPLMNDFAVISLSDLLTPWEVIEGRLRAAAQGDFVVALYNPRSKKRTGQIERAREIFLEHKGAATPVGIVRNARRGGEEAVVTTLGEMLDHPIDMLTTVIIGNSRTLVRGGFMVTPRGYPL